MLGICKYIPTICSDEGVGYWVEAIRGTMQEEGEEAVDQGEQLGGLG